MDDKQLGFAFHSTEQEVQLDLVHPNTNKDRGTNGGDTATTNNDDNDEP
jgi:hypothetical protein